MQDKADKQNLPIMPSGAAYVLARSLGPSCRTQDWEALVSEAYPKRRVPHRAR